MTAFRKAPYSSVRGVSVAAVAAAELSNGGSLRRIQPVDATH